MVVDDEYMILEGMCHLLPFEDYGIEIVYTAENADQALAYQLEHPVDIVLTDVSMPEMTGLEMIERMKLQNPFIHVIIMSGYQEFEFARKAISLGALDYLVKPIDKQELAKILQNLPDQDSGRKVNFKEQFLAGHIKAAELLKQVESQWFLLCDEPLNQEVYREKTFFHQIYYLHLLEEEPREGIFWEKVSLDSRLEELLDKAERSIFYGQRPGDVEVNTRVLYDNLEGLIEGGKITELLESLLDLETAFRLMMPPVYLTKQFFKNVLSDIYHHFNQANHQNLEDFYVAVEASQNLDRLLELFRKYIYEFREGWTESPHVAEILQLIQEDYAKELSLKKVSAKLYLNSVYLGQIIKRETGHSFAELLNLRRIQVAQQLLLESQATIEKICFQVGYSNIGYFYKIFKRTCGQSPKEYRRKMNQIAKKSNL